MLHINKVIFMRKYVNGTKLLCRVDSGHSGNARDGQWKVGDIISVMHSKYGDGYRLAGFTGDPGWVSRFIEDENKFVPASLRERMKDVI